MLQNEEVLLFVNKLYNSADNPMSCEIASHIGLQGNLFCPRCMAGGDKKHKTSDAGYHSLFEESSPLQSSMLYYLYDH